MSLSLSSKLQGISESSLSLNNLSTPLSPLVGKVKLNAKERGDHHGIFSEAIPDFWFRSIGIRKELSSMCDSSRMLCLNPASHE
jgi:hypothetical protein